MLVIHPHPTTAPDLDKREDILAMIRMIEYVRGSLPPAQQQAADKHLQAAIDAITSGVFQKH